VAGRVENVEPQAFDLDAVALGDPHGDDVGVGVLAHNGDAVGAVAERAEPGDMVGVKISVHSLDQFEVELADQLQVAVDPLQHRIDDQRLAAVPAGDEIGVGTRRSIEQLAEDHGAPLLMSSLANSSSTPTEKARSASHRSRPRVGGTAASYT
jgi:hypothetical protein